MGIGKHDESEPVVQGNKSKNYTGQPLVERHGATGFVCQKDALAVALGTMGGKERAWSLELGLGRPPGKGERLPEKGW